MSALCAERVAAACGISRDAYNYGGSSTTSLNSLGFVLVVTHAARGSDSPHEGRYGSTLLGRFPHTRAFLTSESMSPMGSGPEKPYSKADGAIVFIAANVRGGFSGGSLSTETAPERGTAVPTVAWKNSTLPSEKRQLSGPDSGSSLWTCLRKRVKFDHMAEQIHFPALARLLCRLFGYRILVRYSSNRTPTIFQECQLSPF